MRGGMIFLALVVVGCGGDSSAPSPAFPDAAGVYNVSGDFDGTPSEEASFTGTVTLTQASRDQGALGGSASMTAKFGSDAATASDDALDQASVSTAGAITFTLVDPSGSWTFTGTLAGNSITGGRHTLDVPGTGTISGNWTASRTTSSTSAMRIQKRASGLGAIAGALRR
jgi:hypothetical protein